MGRDLQEVHHDVSLDHRFRVNCVLIRLRRRIAQNGRPEYLGQIRDCHFRLGAAVHSERNSVSALS